MTEAIFGLIGVFIGSAISWFQTYWIENRAIEKNARYLAIRVVCILDKYLEDCIDIVKDDGLRLGQRTPEGYLEPQVKVPGPPIFPDDVDWKSIDHELMYKILSLPTEVEGAERIIRAAYDIAVPPDFEDWFDERAFRYAQFGIAAYNISEELSKKYGIQMKIYQDWNPVEELKSELAALTERRQKRMEGHRNSINRILGKK